ncbi:hypothetical protein WEI85_35425 [Actinomycetes bacterium KLBMP 9797]
MDEGSGGNRFRRLPPRVRPTGTEQDVSGPPPTREVKPVSALSPAGGVQAYEQVADYLAGAPRASWRRTALLVVLGLNGLALLAYALYQMT